MLIVVLLVVEAHKALVVNVSLMILGLAVEMPGEATFFARIVLLILGS